MLYYKYSPSKILFNDFKKSFHIILGKNQQDIIQNYKNDFNMKLKDPKINRKQLKSELFSFFETFLNNLLKESNLLFQISYFGTYCVLKTENFNNNYEFQLKKLQDFIELDIFLGKIINYLNCYFIDFRIGKLIPRFHHFTRISHPYPIDTYYYNKEIRYPTLEVQFQIELLRKKRQFPNYNNSHLKSKVYTLPIYKNTVEMFGRVSLWNEILIHDKTLNI